MKEVVPWDDGCSKNDEPVRLKADISIELDLKKNYNLWTVDCHFIIVEQN